MIFIFHMSMKTNFPIKKKEKEKNNINVSYLAS